MADGLAPTPEPQGAIDPNTGLIRDEVRQKLKKLADEDPHLTRLRDTARAMQAAPVASAVSEMSQLQGGGAINFNPLLAWASGLPGASKDLGAIAAASPYRPPEEILKGLMEMGGAASSAQQNYLNQRDKFMKAQMGGGAGGMSVADKAFLEVLKGQGRSSQLQTKQEFDRDEAEKARIFAEGQAELDRAIKKAALEGNLALKKQLQEIKDKKDEEERERKVANDYADFTTDSAFEGLTSSLDTLKRVSKVLSKYKKGDELPGIGMLDRPGKEWMSTGKDYVEKWMGEKPDSWIQDSKDIRQFTGDIVNIANKMTNSARATDKDYDRVLMAKGFGMLQTEEQALSQFREMRRAAKRSLRSLLRGMSKGVRERYDQDKDNIQPEDFDAIRLPGDKGSVSTKKKKNFDAGTAKKIREAMEAAKKAKGEKK